jgi:predicted SAM-dependent methyltransferase
MKLHLDCVNDYKEGCINCDWINQVKVEKIIDLEKSLKMFKNNSVSKIIKNHVLKHIKNFFPLMKEIHGTSKKGAILKFKSLYGEKGVIKKIVRILR